MTPLTLAYTCEGVPGAPVLVLGNSLGTTTAMWAAQLESFTGRFRVLRWDLPGHGASPPPRVPVTIATLGTAVIAILDELRVAQVAYCGISLGAMVGMALAAQHPGRVQRLALCCTAAQLTPARAWDERAATVRDSGMATIATTVISRWFTPEFGARRSDVVASMTEAFVATDAQGYAGCCEAIGAMDLRASLSLIRCPTLVVSAADDTAIPPARGAEIAAGIAGSGLVCVERAAHLATIERADTITPLLLQHFGT